MATRRLAAASLRGASARATASAAPCLHAPRASFSSASQAPRNSIPRPQLRMLRNIARERRCHSDPPNYPKSQFWSFEQIKVALSPANTSKPRVTLIDVREPDEVRETGRIPGALNVPIMSQADSFFLSADEFRDRYGFERPGDGGEDEKIVFYCKAGVRSRSAAELAMQAGWKNVGEYAGSWLDWVKNGGDIQIGGKVRKAEKEKEKGKGDGEGGR
ncbi:Rhodanese-like protein [Annulohypoxylon truncatum]|uniref:Rhodanese-like protein n=1 Tax=Annulohypoxylon truncatum TaxID=327061 RepID=UPI002008545F|nr:Rhodanese-like protein [Annulohypoxylon truncatum]KAI1205716.1 Rhodanese-like protein [Annulohypoxylon truncatum]